MLKKILKKVSNCGTTHSLLKAENQKEDDKFSCLFVHIPKTAGTSFRMALDDSQVTVCDYGFNSKATSPLVLSYLYEKNDFLGFKQQFETGQAWLVGHFNLRRFINMTNCSYMVTFLREPCAQVISHYNHQRKHNGYDKSLEEFIKSPAYNNLQSRMLDGLPIGLMGNIGITEQFSSSLTLINHTLALELEEKTNNISKEKYLTEQDVDDELKQRIRNANLKDIALYNNALWLQEQRLSSLKNGTQYVHGHVARAVYNPNLLVGAAYIMNSETSVKVCLTCNGKVIKTTLAAELHRQHPRVKFNRDGYIGFQFAIPKSENVNDEYHVIVEETGQRLNFHSFLHK
ncbi:hypothetical protein [Shewanella youngdeokensis]|uniref:Sulfotransferase family protein n=1 Tax=Shewanella youngdeokensis TaxID=2999068 RepID=A0ABZ0K195_9GAMM|nr:hypothetical protein RGE70_05840 [Shewanella sp. DAU334]